MDDTSRPSSPSDAASSSTPDLGRFTFERELGRGGAGVVYLCRDPDLHRPVAVKVLSQSRRSSEASPSGSGSSEQQEVRLAKFQREARLLAAINHPNIATIYSIEETPSGSRLLVLEYVEGETLSSRLRRNRLSVAEALHIALQIARAIAAAHSKQIIHRDIKPSNVILSIAGEVKVLDFGLSKHIRTARDDEHDSSSTDASEMRRRLVGTLGFMSPEQARGKGVDSRTDVWSFGCILYYMLSGKPAFLGKTPRDLLTTTLHHDPNWNLLHPDTPEEVRDLLMHTLEKDAIARLDDINRAVELLERLTRTMELPARSVQQQPQSQARIQTSQQSATGHLPSVIATDRKRKSTDQPQAVKVSHPPAGSDVILFTAFEPSGDAHAAPVIAELIRRAPHLKVFAWGGPQMEAAGATLIERTVEDASMGINALTTIARFRSYIRAIKRWSKKYRVLAYVPVDSPAANFPICKIMRRHGVRIIHLVAPQIWAWAGWRIRKLRRLTDMVLCVLPFEEPWFRDRDVQARFIGHPAINRKWDEDAIRNMARSLPSGTPRLALFPGSRTHEVNANIHLLINAFTELQGRHQGLTGVIVAASEETSQIIKRKVKVFPIGLHLTRTKAEAAIMWCDIAIAVSGTISLDITRQYKPMVAVYKTGPLAWLASKLILRTPLRLLPNIVAGREICPEFIPHLGGASPIIEACSRLLIDSKNAAIQTEGLRRVAMRFSNKRPAEEAANIILQVMKKG